MTSTETIQHTSTGLPRKPEFIRLPPPGQRCQYTGLSRSGLNNLILPCAVNGHKPPVRSVCLRQRGAVRGTRLICYHSLMSYIVGQECATRKTAA
jgi:hypothetical protein